MSKEITGWVGIEPKSKAVRILPRNSDQFLLLAEIKGIVRTPAVYANLNVDSTYNVFATGQPKIVLMNNQVPLPYELTNKLEWNEGDELFADIFNEELKQIVIGKKLSGEDAVKGLDKITAILDEKC